MKRLILIPIIVFLTSCQLFLSPDPDNSPIGIFNAIWNDFNETYALFDHKRINWDEQYRIFSPQIRQDMNDYDLFSIISSMLSVLNDRHVSLISPLWWFTSGCNDFGDGDRFSAYLFREYYLENSNLTDGGILYGTFKNNSNIGYIHIDSFLVNGKKVDDWVMEIGGIVNSLKNTDALVLDVRNNTGGRDPNMQNTARYFFSKQSNTWRSRTKNGPGRNDFTDWTTSTISSVNGSYTKPIALLTNRYSGSASELFTVAMKTQDHVTHIGRPTGGAVSTIIFRYLINGWSYTISIQNTTDMDGNRYDAKGLGDYGGINPDFYIENYERDWKSWSVTDSQADFAIEYLLEKLAN